MGCSFSISNGFEVKPFNALSNNNMAKVLCNNASGNGNNQIAFNIPNSICIDKNPKQKYNERRCSDWRSIK